MSFIVQGMKMPQHNAMHGEKDTIYRAAVRVRADGTADLIVNYQGGFTFEEGDLQRAPIVEIPTPHGRLVDADSLIRIYEPLTAFPEEERILSVDSVIRDLKTAPAVIKPEE